MKYYIRRLLNKLTRGRYIKIRYFLSSKVTDEIEYYLGTDIGNQLFFTGKFEAKELKLCANFIKSNSNVVDIGANIGIHSIFFAKIAKNGKVISIEPNIEIYPTLLKNISKYQNIIPCNVAIDSNFNITEFFIASDNAYSSLKDTKRKKIISKKLVITLPFDVIAKTVYKIDFIKIDVEGFEYNVLTSMENLLKKDKPTLFVEIYKGTNSNDNPEKTINYLLNMGYKAYFVNDIGLLEDFTTHDDKYYNYFFIYEY